ncbi:hypothetical protein FDA94_31830 [Herbidospora galbida]|uniref:Uncharacterized protein n=1 Tax=Herbidospora galbida TaxID=2575442 RepID=A0A4U3M8V3_9ACTN|nr:hypothetical protein [Herbidospora galbida]TKK83956.1 hypothetical protein FDA94_31830 [Herbidospora galbida]
MADGERPSDPRVKRWLHLLKQRATIQIDSVKIIESNVFEPQVISFDRATAIVGYHGTGKTVLARMLEVAFGYRSPGHTPPLFVNHDSDMEVNGILTGIIDVTLSTGATKTTRTIDLSWGGGQRRQAWGEQIPHTWDVTYASAVTAFDDLVLMYQEYPRITKFTSEEFPPFSLSRADLNGIKNILGRHYESVVVNPVVVSGTKDSPLDYCPYVVAETPYGTVDSGKMSLGEIWVHFVLNWVMRQEGSAFVIDEPESFLSNLGQRPFIDEMARSALASDSQFIVATHSEQILSRFPLDNIRMCVRTDGKVRVIAPTSRTQIRDAVGVDTPLRAFVLVEDDFAALLLRAMCAEIAPWVLREAEVIASGGAAEVVAALRAFRTSSRIGSIAILDGDQRQSSVTKKAAPGLFYFPGTGDPEQELLNAVEAGGATVAKLLGRPSGDIVAALTSTAHLDHQYQLRAFSERLGLQFDFVIQMLVRLWMRKPGVRRQAQSIATALEDATSGM